MSVFFALDMTIGLRVSTSGPTCRVQKIAILLGVSYKISKKKAHILIKILFKSAISIIFRDNTLRRKINA
jgi:hypothetical protein